MSLLLSLSLSSSDCPYLGLIRVDRLFSGWHAGCVVQKRHIWSVYKPELTNISLHWWAHVEWDRTGLFTPVIVSAICHTGVADKWLVCKQHIDLKLIIDVQLHRGNQINSDSWNWCRIFRDLKSMVDHNCTHSWTHLNSQIWNAYLIIIQSIIERDWNHNPIFEFLCTYQNPRTSSSIPLSTRLPFWAWPPPSQ